jgi:3D (Asp-Asp-Asp) domain-containing protein
LAEAEVTLYAGDRVIPPAGAWLEPGAEIVVQRALSLTIQVDGRTVPVRTALTRPIGVLAEQGIALMSQDFTRPAATAELESGDTIEVVRVTEGYRFADEAIPYETAWQATDTLELDQKQLLTPGVAGILRRRFRQRYENGAELGEEPAGEWIAQVPVNAVMGYGTRVVVRVLETPEGAYEYWRVVRMRATAYTAASAGKPPDHPGYGITASGLQAGTGIVAIDPRVVPFRSWVYVPGYGLGYAGDTGGGVKGRWIDLGYDEDALKAWNTYVDVYFLAPAPPPDQINYLIPEVLP